MSEPANGTTAAKSLFSSHIHMAEMFARMFVGRVKLDYDELQNLGRAGLWKAAQSFLVSKGVEFRTYAGLRIRGEILDAVRSMNIVPRCAHRSGVKVECKGLKVGIDRLSPEPDVEEQVSRAELGQLARELVDSLPRRERELVRRHYFEGERFDHVARDLGLSKSWASRIHTRAIQRLQRRAQRASLARPISFSNERAPL